MLWWRPQEFSGLGDAGSVDIELRPVDIVVLRLVGVPVGLLIRRGSVLTIPPPLCPAVWLLVFGAGWLLL